MTTAPVSLAFFSNTHARGGAEEHVLTLLRGLDRRLFQLHLICSPDVAEMLRADLPRDVKLFPILVDSFSHGPNALRLARYLRAERIEILHSHLFCSSLFGSPIARFSGVPAIIETPHVRESWRRGWKASFFVDRLIGRCVDCYIAVSQANADFLVNDKRLPARKVRTIHNGCDLRRFNPVESSQSRLRGALGFQPGDLILLVAARLEPQKGHRVLLDALPPVRRDFPNVRLVCVGDGELRGALEQQARDLHLDDIVRFIGYQPNIPEWLGLADVSVLPSFFEGLPLVAIESLAAARPMVATAVDGTPEVILDGQTGLTVPPGDPDALAKALTRLLRDPELRRRLGQAGRSFVLEHFTQERQIEQTQQLYLDALRQHTGSRSPVSSAKNWQPVNSNGR